MTMIVMELAPFGLTFLNIFSLTLPWLSDGRTDLDQSIADASNVYRKVV